jgi:hypothetical protein
MLAGVLDLPELQLVGVRVYDEAKNGVDPDCVLYAPQFTSVDDVCALLASGKNVATVSPRAHD